jgi:DnaJ family protein C protein 19
MFNFLIFSLITYYFYKNNVKTGKLKIFLRQSLPSLISYLQALTDKIDGKKKHRQNANNQMAVEEARQILGVKPEATKEEVLSAFKKLMLINHPDKGGTEYLAAKIIQAKKTLIHEKT